VVTPPVVLASGYSIVLFFNILLNVFIVNSFSFHLPLKGVIVTLEIDAICKVSATILSIYASLTDGKGNSKETKRTSHATNMQEARSHPHNRFFFFSSLIDRLLSANSRVSTVNQLHCDRSYTLPELSKVS
jgi:hypothetical protein